MKHLSAVSALAAIGLIATLVYVSCGAQTNKGPKDGYVPDEETAIAIAVAVWNPIYGKDQIANEKPYNASLSNGVWTVMGSLPKKNSLGGVAEADISKNGGRILRVIHGK
jgi:hypothetical protein